LPTAYFSTFLEYKGIDLLANFYASYGNDLSSFYMENGSFLRMENLQLGYALPQQLSGKLRLSKLRLYVAGQNLWTLTSFMGIDPEVGGDILGFAKKK
jgi:hypothetical protein